MGWNFSCTAQEAVAITGILCMRVKHVSTVRYLLMTYQQGSILAKSVIKIQKRSQSRLSMGKACTSTG